MREQNAHKESPAIVPACAQSTIGVSRKWYVSPSDFTYGRSGLAARGVSD